MGTPFGHPCTLVAVTAATAGTAGLPGFPALGGTAAIAGCAGTIVKNPHPLPQTFQSIPAKEESFVTAALSNTVVPCRICDGAKGTNAMACAVDCVTVTVVERTVVLENAVAVARICTGTPGTVGGATYFAVAPFAVW